MPLLNERNAMVSHSKHHPRAPQSDGDSQVRLVTALLDPERYPHPAKRVHLIETHISWVLLAGRYAYKIKKSVDLGFRTLPASHCAAIIAKKKSGLTADWRRSFISMSFPSEVHLKSPYLARSRQLNTLLE
jgi:hypothetical protein